MVLANFKFGNLNALHHTHACVNYYWRVLNLAIFQKIHQITKLKTSPNFPAIQYVHHILVVAGGGGGGNVCNGCGLVLPMIVTEELSYM